MQTIEEALARNNYNRLALARELGIHKSTLYRKIKTLDIKLPKLDGRTRCSLRFNQGLLTLQCSAVRQIASLRRLMGLESQNRDTTKPLMFSTTPRTAKTRSGPFCRPPVDPFCTKRWRRFPHFSVMVAP
ncbi:MAG: hypothetical protein HN396_16670 [Gemmatimonadales bacterium]|jgi:hypothetical protein|nr:hypothetical protein [Gemmatimonadales bacterium]